MHLWNPEHVGPMKADFGFSHSKGIGSVSGILGISKCWAWILGISGIPSVSLFRHCFIRILVGIPLLKSSYSLYFDFG